MDLATVLTVFELLGFGVWNKMLPVSNNLHVTGQLPSETTALVSAEIFAR